MRYLVFVYLAVAAVIADESESDKKICEPGARYKQDCNDCTCSVDGKARVCTMMMCPPEDALNSRVRRQTDEPVIAEGEKKICEPGARFKEDCNDCICSGDGKTRVCTMMFCPPQDTSSMTTSPVRQTRQVSHNRDCTPGSRFKIYCNTCTCGADGFSVACTRRACDPNVYNEDGSLKNVEEVPKNSLLRQTRQVSHNRDCTPGERFKIYCNTCTCGADGFSVACTRRACDPNVYNEDGSLKNVEQVTENSLLRQTRQVSHNRDCTPGSRFKIYCNTCTCGADGFSVACTRRACDPNVYNEDGSLKNVEEVPKNSLLRQTRQVSHNRDCTPGERFKIYCNTCTCGADGFSVACTRRACDPNVYNEDGSLKNVEQVTENSLLRQTRQVSHDRDCTPGSRFKVYCNTCTCGADGFSVACTRRACDPNVYNEDGSLKNVEQVTENSLLRQTRQVSHNRDCTPGSRFKIYCNTCTCGADGFSVACTRRACDPNVYNEDGSLKNVEQATENPLLRLKRQVSHNRDCTPGESFKIDCNTCWCGVDGHSVACTKMGCIVKIPEDGGLKNSEPIPTNTLLRRRRQAAHKLCEPGKSFKTDCNSCYCTSEGIPICTAVACGANVNNQDNSLKSV